MNAINFILDIWYDYSALEMRNYFSIEVFLPVADSLKVLAPNLSRWQVPSACLRYTESICVKLKTSNQFLASATGNTLWAWFRVRRTLNCSGSHVSVCKRDSDESLCSIKMSACTTKSVLSRLQFAWSSGCRRHLEMDLVVTWVRRKLTSSFDKIICPKQVDAFSKKASKSFSQKRSSSFFFYFKLGFLRFSL